MRKFLILLGATLVGGVLFAQPHVMGTHPAHDGRLLTMEEAVASRAAYPENRYYMWVNDNEYRFYDGKKWDSARLDESVELPQETGWTAFNVGNSLYMTISLRQYGLGNLNKNIIMSVESGIKLLGKRVE